MSLRMLHIPDAGEVNQVSSGLKEIYLYLVRNMMEWC
jgi:hypothetical protein